MCNPNHQAIPAWVGITYTIYAVSLAIILFGGSGYAVFVLGHSEWWILAAVVIASFGYRPGRWAEIVTGDTGMSGDKIPAHHRIPG